MKEINSLYPATYCH